MATTRQRCDDGSKGGLPVRRLLRFAALAFSVAALSCSDTTSLSHGVASVVLRLPHDSLFLGRSVRAVAVATGDSVAVAHPRFVWSTSDTTVAVVDSLGTILGVGVGTARITAELNGRRDDFTIRIVLQRAGGGVAFVTGSDAYAFGGQCALTAAGAVYCRRVGTLTDSMPLFKLMPGAAGIAFASIYSAIDSECGLSTTGQIYCWGVNHTFIWGTRAGPTRADSAPVAVKQGTLRFSAMAHNGHANICGISSADSVVYCWGHNDEFQNGRAPAASTDSNVAPVTGSPRGIAVSNANFNGCLLDPGGMAFCWGGPTASSLGISEATTNVPAPQLVAGGLTFAKISAGEAFQCAVTPSGDAYCWGIGALGNGSLAQPNPFGPQKVVGGHHFSMVSVSGFPTSACGITTDGDLYCWGAFRPASLSTRLGDRVGTPTHLLPGLKFRALSGSLNDMCAITVDGSALCW